MNPRMQLHLDCPTGIPGRSFRTGFGLQYKLRREKQTADKLINKSSATARAIILRRGAPRDRYVGEWLFNRGNLSPAARRLINKNVDSLKITRFENITVCEPPLPLNELY